MTMSQARFLVVVFGILVPYLARLPGGSAWLAQYTDGGFLSWLLIGVLNAIARGCLVALSFNYERPVALLVPCTFGFGFLAWAHSTVDLSADAQAAVALVIIPIYALVPIRIGGALGYIVDRVLRRKERA